MTERRTVRPHHLNTDALCRTSKEIIGPRRLSIALQGPCNVLILDPLSFTNK